MTKNTDGPSSQPAATNERWGLAVLAGATLLASLGISVASVALPTLAQFFSAPLADVQWVVLAYLIAMTVVIVAVGWLGDRYGQRVLLNAGFGIFGVSSAACALAPSLDTLIAARVAQGLGGAMLMALPLSIAKNMIEKERLGTAMGLFGTMSAIGTALGPSLGGMMISAFGWQSAFAFIAALSLAMMAAGLSTLPHESRCSNVSGVAFDSAGTGLLGVTLLAYALAVTGRGSGMLWLLPLFTLPAFVMVELRAKSPLVPMDILLGLRTASGLVMNVLIATIMMSTLVVGPFFLTFGLGLNVGTVGMVMAVGPIVSAFSGVPAGRLTDRFGAQRILGYGLLSILITLIVFATLPRLAGVVGYVAALALLTPGFQLFLAANNTATMMAAPGNRRGTLSGLLGLSRNIGFMTGASAMAALFAATAGSSDPATFERANVGAAFTTTFLVAAALVLPALVLALPGFLRRQD